MTTEAIVPALSPATSARILRCCIALTLLVLPFSPVTRDLVAQQDGKSTAVNDRPARAASGKTLERSPQNSLTFLGGAFAFASGNGWVPYGSMRLGRELSRYVNAEVGVGYARTTTRFYSLVPVIQSFEARTPFAAVDAAIQAQLPIGAFVPYVGGSVGWFKVRADPLFGGGENGPSTGAMGGLKVLLSQRMGIRGELRYRADQRSAFRARDFEESAGFLYRF
jgi:hypothetical protein